MAKRLSENEFNLWRAILAIAHKAGSYTPEEGAKLSTYFTAMELIPEQDIVLHDEIVQPQDVGEILSYISDDDKIIKFFEFCRILYWYDGVIEMQEKAIQQAFLNRALEQHSIESAEKALIASRDTDLIISLQEDPEFDIQPFMFCVELERVFPELKELAKQPTESEFNMWRAVFALAHADGVVTEHELKFMHKVLHQIKFTEKQRETLLADIEHERNVEELYGKIETYYDRCHFFYMARLLCWSDNDFDAQEQEILTRLEAKNLHDHIEDLLDEEIHLQFEDDETFEKTDVASETFYKLKAQQTDGFLGRLFAKIRKNQK